MKKDDHEVMKMNPVDLRPIGGYQTSKWEFCTVRGLILPSTGERLMEMNHRSERVLTIYSRFLKAEKFSIKGTWVYIPDPESLRIDPINTNSRL